MKKGFPAPFGICLLLVLFLPSFGQTNAKIEQELIGALKDIQKYSSYGKSYDSDNLSKTNEVFADKLLKYTKIASTLDYKFPALSKLMFNASSADGKLRIYSWDTEEGGTMHSFSRVYQYLGADGKVYSKPDERSADEGTDEGSFINDIFTLDIRGGKVYIVSSTAIASTIDNYQSASLYKIVGTILDKAKLLKTNSGLTNSLGFGYNFFSVVDRPERPVKLISFDRKTNTLKIPVVIEDTDFPNGRVTGKFISYRFNGTNFVKVR